MIVINNTGRYSVPGSIPRSDACWLDSTHSVFVTDNNVSVVNIVDGVVIGSTTANFTSESAYGVSVCALDSNYFIITWIKSADDTVKIKCGYYNGSTISMGTLSAATSTQAVHRGSSYAYQNALDVAKISSTAFIIAYGDKTNSKGRVVVGTISGTTISITPDSTYSFHNVDINNCAIICNSSTRFTVAYSEDSTGDLRVNTGTISGTTITISDADGTFVDSSVGTLYTTNKLIDYLDSTHVIVGYFPYNAGTTKFYAKIIENNAGSFTIGDTLTISENATDSEDMALCALSLDYVCFGWQDTTTTPHYGKIKLAKTNLTTHVLTASEEQIFENNDSDEITVTSVPSTSVLAVFFESGIDNNGKVNVDANPIFASVSTSACSSVTNTTLTGNGTINNVGYASCTRRGFCYKVYDGSDPTTADSTAYDDGTFSTGAYTKGITGLTANVQYSIRAYAVNSEGTSYGTTVNQYTNGITDPANVYADDADYATCHATNGNLKVKLSKDAGVNWSSELSSTFVAGEATNTYGNGSTEVWALSWTGADVNSATDFVLRITVDNAVQSTWSFAGFGFALGAGVLLTGIKVEVKAKYDSNTLSINHIKITVYYGTSVIPIVAGAIAFASDGRKDGEGAGAGTGLQVYYDGTNWIRPSDDSIVAA